MLFAGWAGVITNTEKPFQPLNRSTLFYLLSVYRASFCAVIACERARLVSKMVLIAGGGPVPLVGVTSCDVFCLPAPMLSCIKPVFLSVYERSALNCCMFYLLCHVQIII